MRIITAAALACFSVAAAAQTAPVTPIAIKGGETVDIGPIYWVNSQTCQSLSTTKSDVEILEGPPGITIDVKEDMVIPVAYGCKNKIKGGHIMLTVPEGVETSAARLIIRLTHHAKDGDHKRGMVYNLLIAH